jgi:hypothetical protein
MLEDGRWAMIAAVGFMVGAYILTRMVQVLTQPKERADSTLVQVLAVLTSIVAVLVMAYMFFGPTPTALR